MLEQERLDQILNHLKKTQTATVHTLAKLLYTSETTVRRDLNQLAKQGFVKRLHGGVMLLEGSDRELPLYMRSQQNVEAKKIIAARAANYLKDGQTIFLDASSTVMYLAPYFENHHSLTIITNGVKTAENLAFLDHRIYCTGGMMLHNSSAYVGDYAIQFIRQFNADIFFFSSRGLSERNWITDASSEETQVRKAMMEQSRMSVFLYDQSKCNQTFCYNLCNLSQVDVTISDSNSTAIVE